MANFRHVTDFENTPMSDIDDSTNISFDMGPEAKSMRDAIISLDMSQMRAEDVDEEMIGSFKWGQLKILRRAPDFNKKDFLSSLPK